MDPTRNRYWPFNVLPLEQRTEQHRREIGFLETAHQAGYKPYTFGNGSFGATAGIRAGEILFRGRKHWQVCLAQENQLIVSAHVDNFDYAAEAILRWLRGVEASDIVEYVRSHLLRTRATGAGFVLHGPQG
jgi:hypothetical protein